MRIAFDLRKIQSSGIGRYMRSIVEALVREAPEHEYLLLIPPGCENLLEVNGGNTRILPVEIPYYSIQEQAAIPALLLKHRVELFHSPHFVVPIVRTCPVVVSIHDVIYMARKKELKSALGRLYYRCMMPLAARLSDAVITSCEYTRNEIVRHLKVSPNKIFVVPYGIDSRFRPIADPSSLARVRRKYGIDEKYILYVGIYRDRKNHAGLLQAFHHLLQAGISSQLVIAGPTKGAEADLQKLQKLGRELGIENRLLLTGFVPEEDLPALYSGARVYACPSLAEGFSLTVIEAMACGAPVVCAQSSALPEAAGSAALFADATNPRQFGQALQRAFTDNALRSDLIALGYKHAERFCWKRAAHETLEIYRIALNHFAPKR